MSLPRVVIQRLHEEITLSNLLYRLNKLQQELEKMDPNHPSFSIVQVGVDHIKSEAQESASRIKKFLLRETLTSVKNNGTKAKRIFKRTK